MFFFFSSRRRHTRLQGDWSSDVCSSDLSVRKTFDSLRVELLEGALAVHCRLDTRAIPPDALGPLGPMLNPMEPLRLAGPGALEGPRPARRGGGGAKPAGAPPPRPEEPRHSHRHAPPART